MKIKLSKKQWEDIGNNTGWLKTSQFELPDNHPEIREKRFEEFDKKNTPSLSEEVVNDDNRFRRRNIRVEMDDGDVITTAINGTKQDIVDYYTKNDFVKQDETTSHRGVRVEFLD